MNSKEKVLLPTVARHRPFQSSWSSRLLRIISLAAILGTVHLYTKSKLLLDPFDAISDVPSTFDFCPQTEAIRPNLNAHIYAQVGGKIETNEYRLRAVDWMSGAIREPTESYDTMGAIGEDPRWDTFGSFHDYLRSAFPLT